MDPAVERFLDRLRAALRGMPASEIDDVVLELRGHVAERLESAPDPAAALRALGDPAELARQYRHERATARAGCSRSPIVLLHGLLLLRRESWLGWISLALAALGYAWSFALAGAAIEKLLSPHDVGFWQRPGSLSLPWITVDGPGPAGSHELLGWWFVPAGLAAGALLFVLTGWFARWRIRRTHAAAALTGL